MNLDRYGLCVSLEDVRRGVALVSATVFNFTDWTGRGVDMVGGVVSVIADSVELSNY